jgi:ribosomal protein S10
MRLYCVSCNKYNLNEVADYIQKVNGGISCIRLPTKIEKYTLLKAPSRYKKHLQQIERRVYKLFFNLKELPQISLSQFTDVTVYIK